MVSDADAEAAYVVLAFQSALRFAVVSDCEYCTSLKRNMKVSIRFEVRGGFRPRIRRIRDEVSGFNPL